MIIQKVGLLTWIKTSIKNLVTLNLFGYEFKLNLVTSYTVIPQIKAVGKRGKSLSLKVRKKI